MQSINWKFASVALGVGLICEMDSLKNLIGERIGLAVVKSLLHALELWCPSVLV